MSVTATSRVVTERGERYRKQLASPQPSRRRGEQQLFGHSALVDRVAGGQRGADLVGQRDRQEPLL